MLTLSRQTIAGGVEVYAQFLKKTIPTLKLIGQEDIPKTNKIAIPFMREPLVGKELAKIIKSSKPLPDLIFCSGMQGWALNLDENIPTITILHGTFAGLAENGFRHSPFQFWRMRYIYTYFEKHSALNANICISNSLHTQQEAKKFYNIDSRIIYPPIDTKIFKPGSKKKARHSLKWTNNDKKQLLYVGNPTISKGWDIILALAERHPELIIHAITVPKIESKKDNIICYPPQTRDKLIHFYRAADALIFPSRYEGYGFVPLEALASGCPVITSRTGIFHEYTPKNAIITQEHTVDEFEKALCRILEHKLLISDYPEIAKKFSFKQFSKKILEAVSAAKKYNNSRIKKSKFFQKDV